VYRKTFWIPKEDEGRRIVLEFEGAMGVSVLNINGQKAKEHFCGYTPLVADVSAFLNYGAMNQVEVLLDNSDNSEVPPGKPQADLDFSYDGGLYRDAKLIVTDRLHISHPLLANEVGGGGVLVWFTDVSDDQATVHAKVHVQNDHAEDKACLLTAEILSAEGAVVGQCAAPCKTEGNSVAYVEVAIDVTNPSLWSPETPNLYTLRTALTVAESVVYVQDTTIGIRTFEFTIHDGVIFNGKSRRFNGANYHQTWPYIGNAVPNSLLKRDLKLIKSMGMDNVRSHYPFSSAFVEECNRLGLTLVISNVGWQFCQPGIFLERTLQNMRDIIRWQRNNPCVLLWEPILNESPMSYEVQLNFHNAVHEEFPYAPCYTASDWGPTDVAYRDYDPEMLGGWMENGEYPADFEFVGSLVQDISYNNAARYFKL
jgi:beta-galactosidase